MYDFEGWGYVGGGGGLLFLHRRGGVEQGEGVVGGEVCGGGVRGEEFACRVEVGGRRQRFAHCLYSL